MTVSSPFSLRWLCAATLLGLLAAPVWAQYRAPQAPVESYPQVAPNGYRTPAAPAPNRYAPPTGQRPGRYVQGRRPFRTAQRTETPAHIKKNLEHLNNANAGHAPSLETTAGQEGEHPLMPALRWAYSGVKNIEKVQDYSATIVKRERIGNTVGGYEYMFVKIRHKPFSVYTRFLALVSNGRDLPVATLEPLAGGRVYDGGEARQNGLIDRFGDINDAIARAAELAELDDEEIVYVTREDDLGWFGSLFGASARTDVQADPLAGLNPAPRALIDHYGQEISFNQPQKLCGKCHGQVYRSWRNGIHGKRIGMWGRGGKKRWWVCTECHNPHDVQQGERRSGFAQLSPELAPELPKGMPNADHERHHGSAAVAAEH